MSRRLRRACSALTVAMFCLTLAGAKSDDPVLLKADFEDGDLAGWKMTDAKAWRVEKVDESKALALFGKSNYTPKVRSPFNYALLDDLVVTDFTLDCKVKSTVKDYGHRDLCLIFGYQDPEHFYYIHLGKNADPHAHSVFLVNNEPRVSIAKDRTAGTPWTDDWHKVRLVRNAASGEITVYFDDMTKPIMRANDKTFAWGKVGVGSFDDTGVFDDITVRGKKKE